LPRAGRVLQSVPRRGIRTAPVRSFMTRAPPQTPQEYGAPDDRIGAGSLIGSWTPRPPDAATARAARAPLQHHQDEVGHERKSFDLVVSGMSRQERRFPRTYSDRWRKPARRDGRSARSGVSGWTVPSRCHAEPDKARPGRGAEWRPASFPDVPERPDLCAGAGRHRRINSHARSAGISCQAVVSANCSP
jgi:hypothetical protein